MISAFAVSLTLFNSHIKLFAIDTLGCRLEGEGTEKRCLQACLCYICSGNIEKLVECWALHRDCSSPLGLEVGLEQVFLCVMFYNGRWLLLSLKKTAGEVSLGTRVLVYFPGSG